MSDVEYLPFLVSLATCIILTPRSTLNLQTDDTHTKVMSLLILAGRSKKKKKNTLYADSTDNEVIYKPHYQVCGMLKYVHAKL